VPEKEEIVKNIQEYISDYICSRCEYGYKEAGHMYFYCDRGKNNCPYQDEIDAAWEEDY
jgi:hypothetical protein